MSSIPDNAPSPRLCIIVKWPDFEGYGFNLHAEKSKPGQYIGKVDDHSPAEKAGLMEGDRIIEVNGANIANENHKQVVQRIKAVPNETRLLVVDPQTDKYYKSKNIVVRGTQENVVVRNSAREQKAPPSPARAVSNGHHEDADNRSVSSAASSSAASEASTQPQHAAAVAEADKDSPVEEIKSQEPMEGEKSPSPSPPPSEEVVKPSDEDFSAPEEDRTSLGGSDKLSEKDSQGEGSLPETSDPSDVPLPEDTPADSEHPLPEADGVEEERAESPAPPPPPPELESDLEAEYDNVDLAAGAAGANAAPAACDSRRLSASSGESHSSHGSDTAHTDPRTQSPMSTSPTPPPSLDPAPSAPPAADPAPVQHTPPPVSPASTITTSKPQPAPQSVASNNAYNSSGLNLNMSAAEMRAMLARKKKADPRKDTVDLKKKYEIIQNM